MQFTKPGVVLTSLLKCFISVAIDVTPPRVSTAELFPLQGRVAVVLMVMSMVELGVTGRDLLLVVE